MTSKLIAALAFIGLNFYVFHFMGRDIAIPPRESFVAYPNEIGSYACSDRQVLEDEIIDNLGVTDYIACNYIDEESSRWTQLYVGYHERQARSDEGKSTTIHPPEHCLPGSGWDIVSSDIVPIDFGIPGEAKRVMIARGNDRQLVYFWYQSRGHVIARDSEKILRMFADRATTGRTDGALVRITVPIERERGVEAAEAQIKDFARLAIPGLDPFVPR